MKKSKKKFQSYFSREVIVTTLIFSMVWAVLTYFLFFFNLTNQVGDTTFVAQVLNNFKYTYRMQTTYYTSTTESIDHVWYKKAEEVCNMDLETKFTNTPWGHHYFIAYALIPLARVMDVQFLIALLHAGIYTSVLVFSYVFARMKRLNVILALLFTILVLQHPLWDTGLTGQFYFNRFFLPFSALTILLLEKKKSNYLFIGIAGLLAASTNEIYGIIIFMIMLSHMWIRRKIDIKVLFLAILLLATSVVSTIYIQKTFPLGSTQTDSLARTFSGNIHTTTQYVWSNIQDPKTQTFLIVNIFSMGIFVFFDVWLIAPLVLVMLPNLLISVGAAEKIGWSSHYHTGYFIPLIWLSLLGLSKLNIKPRLQAAFILCCIVLIAYINPYDLYRNQKPNFVPKKLFQNFDYYRTHGKFSLDFRRRLRNAVKDGEKVSAPEAIAYNFFDHTMYYYPMGIDSVDVVLLKVDKTKTGDKKYYSINYGHQDPDLDACIIERMKKGGFDFSDPIIVDGWAVIRRK